MLPLSVPRDPAVPVQLLCLGAHADDIEIGCGGTVLQLLSDGWSLDVMWVVFSAAGQREREARMGASFFLGQAWRQRVIVRQFRDGFFPYEGARIKECFEELAQEVNPDLIFTHYREDRHQDHRTISDLTWNTWRRHLILEYEIPKYDGDLGAPNCFVPLDDDICARKIEHILAVFQTQGNKAWMTDDTFRAILRLRGLECAAPGRYAEAFHCRKFILSHGGLPP